jgi:hypothetical protein
MVHHSLARKTHVLIRYLEMPVKVLTGKEFLAQFEVQILNETVTRRIWDRYDTPLLSPELLFSPLSSPFLFIPSSHFSPPPDTTRHCT